MIDLRTWITIKLNSLFKNKWKKWTFQVFYSPTLLLAYWYPTLCLHYSHQCVSEYLEHYEHLETFEGGFWEKSRTVWSLMAR